MKLGDLVTISLAGNVLDSGIVIKLTCNEFFVFWFGLDRIYNYELNQMDNINLLSEC